MEDRPTSPPAERAIWTWTLALCVAGLAVGYGLTEGGSTALSLGWFLRVLLSALCLLLAFRLRHSRTPFVFFLIMAFFLPLAAFIPAVRWDKHPQEGAWTIFVSVGVGLLVALAFVLDQLLRRVRLNLAA